jgi:hypothetical protein
MSLLIERCPLPKRMILPFIVQGGPPYRGSSGERERESLLAPLVGVVSSVSRDRQLRQSEALCGHCPSLVSRSVHLVLSLYVVLRRSGDGCVPISMVWQSRFVPDVTPCHCVVTEAYSPYGDDVASCPFKKTGRWNSVPLLLQQGEP